VKINIQILEKVFVSTIVMTLTSVIGEDKHSNFGKVFVSTIVMTLTSVISEDEK
jgi:hypothetical protein